MADIGSKPLYRNENPISLMSLQIARFVFVGKKVIVGQNDLASQRPQLVKSWQVKKNLPLTPESVTFGSSSKVWWICELGHDWEAIISNRARPSKLEVNLTATLEW